MVHRLHQKSFKVEPRGQKKPPSISPMEILSLQQVSTEYVIAHLEEFPPETLALLPLRIRHELLLSLPPADILQLEQTRVVNGIDMEEIWKEVSQRYDFELARREYPQARSKCTNMDLLPCSMTKDRRAVESAQTSWKAYILACIYALLLHLQPFPVMNMKVHSSHHASKFTLDVLSRNYLILLQLLFCMHFLTVQQIRSSTCFRFAAVQTGFPGVHSRYTFFFSTKVEVLDILTFLLESCHIQPPESISIDDRYFVWNQAAVISKLNPAYQQFFSRVKEAEFIHMWRQHGVDPMVAVCKLSWIYDAMLSCSTPMLESITFKSMQDIYSWQICEEDQFYSLIITMLAEYFGISKRSSRSISTLSCLPYLGCLKHANIWAGSLNVATFCIIAEIIQNHNLVTVVLCGPNFECDVENLIADLPQILGSCFLPVFPPSLSSIGFKYIRKLPLSLLLWLNHKFLYSPANGHQEMALERLTIDYKKVPTIKDFEHISSDRLALPHKTLILRIQNVETSFFELFSQFPSIVLDKLEIPFYFQGSDAPNLDVQAIGAFVNHPASQIETRLYSLDFDRLKDSSETMQSFRGGCCHCIVLPHILKTELSIVSESLFDLIRTLFSQPEHLPHVELIFNFRSIGRRVNLQELASCLYVIWKDMGNERKLRRLVITGYNRQTLGDTHDAVVAELRLISNTAEICL